MNSYTGFGSQLPLTKMPDDTRKFGVAFSGGGIRSAAFCSGVLRRLIRKGKEPDFLSCVSGGGYTGSAYVQWKYHKEGESKWTDKFFDKMREQTGYICNWQSSCLQGCGDSCVFVVLLVVVAIIGLAGWLSFAFPIAFLVKLIYGKFLDGKLCSKSPGGIDCLERSVLFTVTFGVFALFHLLEYFLDRCENKDNYRKMKVPKVVLKLGQIISGASFAFTFFPWFINAFLQYTDFWIVIVLVTFIFWFFVPIMRKYSSLGILIYAYSYVVFWHVYERKFFYLEYTKKRFLIFLSISFVILAVFSVLGDFQQRLVHIYNRWRLQRAFYWRPDTETKIEEKSRALTLEDLKHLKDEKPLYISSIVVNGWRKNYRRKYCLLTMSPKGISVIDQQPGRTDQPSPEAKVVKTKNVKEKIDDQIKLSNNEASTFSGITHPSSSVKVEIENDDQSKLSNNEASTSSGITHQSSSVKVEIENDDQNKDFIEMCLNGEDFKGKLKPSDIKLSSAMAMSAASVSPYFGRHEEIEQRITHILTVFGIEMGANIVYDMEGERKNSPAYSYVANFVIFLAISVIAVLSFLCVFGIMDIFSPIPRKPSSVSLGVGLFLGVLLLLLPCLWLCRNTKCSSKRSSKFSRWCVVHLPIYRFLRSILNIITYDATPPAMLHLSDGGHFENYGLLPLLKLRLPKILVVLGLKIQSNDDYVKGIVSAMEHARELFGCSFTSMIGDDVLNDIKDRCEEDVLNYMKNMLGGDVLTDIQNKYVKPKDRPRKYEFKVHYSREGGNGVNEGHIVLIAPRPPTESGAGKSDASTSQENPAGPDPPDRIEMSQPSGGSPPVEVLEGGSRTSDNPKWQSEMCEGKQCELNEAEWGTGPFLTKNDVEVIEGCPGCCGCCECCHTPPWCGSCSTFPGHSTVNQFFTPRMFSAYHREGYRACMECDDFLESRHSSEKGWVEKRRCETI